MIRIGTRGSPLALAQAEIVHRLLKKRWPKIKVKRVIIKSLGDEFQWVELFKQKNIGVFTKALEKKLLTHEIDIAVHSLKDLPTRLPKGLALGAFPKRADSRDALLSRQRYSLAGLPYGARVGTGSPRRRYQLARLRPDLEISDLRGNLDTRVAKVLKEKKLDAVVVAWAGLKRLGKYLKYARILPVQTMLPAVGQGALAIELRATDKFLRKIIQPLNHVPTEQAVAAERSFLNTLEGGCRVPVGIGSRVRSGKIFLKAVVFSVHGRDFACAALQGPAAQSQKLGRKLARILLKKGSPR